MIHRVRIFKLFGLEKKGKKSCNCNRRKFELENLMVGVKNNGRGIFTIRIYTAVKQVFVIPISPALYPWNTATGTYFG